MRIYFHLVLILLIISCESRKSYRVLDSSIINIINDVTKSKEVTIGFRTLENNNISFYVIERGINSCVDYYGTTFVNDRNLHLYLRDGVVENDINHLVSFFKPDECIVSKELTEGIIAPDSHLLYEYELIENEFVKISNW